MNFALDHSFFKTYFQQFYEKVLYYKQIALSKPELTQDELNNISQSLIDLLQTQERTISSTTNTFVFNIYKELQYIMAGFADEVFLNLDWSYESKEYWNSHLLEYKLFQTHIAGDQIFSKIDSIITQHESQNLLIPIYIYILSLGFYGRYRMQINVSEEPQEISHYKKQLFNLMYSTNQSYASDTNQETSSLFPNTKLHTLINKNIVHTHAMLLWLGILTSIIITYSLLSYFMFTKQLQPIISIVNNILQMKVL